MVQQVERRTFLAVVGVGSGIAGCFTAEDVGEQGMLAPGGGGGTVATSEEEIGFYVLDADESFDEFEPTEGTAIAWHPTKGRRTWGF